MKAMVLAAGLGTRLRPITNNIPKPLIPVAGKPLIHYTLNLLKRHNIKEVMINLHYLADMIKKEVGDGSRFGIKVHYSYEPDILGTGGGIKKVEDFFSDGTFLVINADILVGLDLSDVVRFHQEKGAIATMVLRHDKDVDSYGAIEIDRDSRIREFLGKIDYQGPPLKKLMFTGIHVLEPEVLSYIPSNISCCINRTAYPEMIKKGERVYGYVMNGYWSDLGTPERYRQAEEDVARGKITL